MYNIKFQIKQKVFTIHKCNMPKRMTCDVCDGDRKIFYKNKYYTCPACKGTSTRLIPINTWVCSNREHFIEQININNRGIFCKFRGNNDQGHPEYGDYYVDQENCFITKSEAEQECELRNSNQEYK